jgi:hypothetical protein
MTSAHEAAHALIAERLKDMARVESALKQAARQAVLEHARAGLPIAVWRDGRVVWEEPQHTGATKPELADDR